MDKKELQERLMNFAVRIIKMVDSMPSSVAGMAIARQIVRSGTSPSRIQPLHQECCELLSIIVKSIVTTKNRMKVEEIEKLQNNKINGKL